jgi:hypothetical protein
MSPDAIRARFVAFLVVVSVSFAVVAFLLVRKLLLKRRAAALAKAARALSLEDLEALERTFGRAGAAELVAAADSPTEFDRVFAALLRDAATRSSIALPDARRMHRIRLALGHGREPTFREIETTRDLDPQRLVLLRARPALLAEVRENGFLVIELGRHRHAIERGRQFRLVVEATEPGDVESHFAEVSIIDAAADVALVAHARLSPDSRSGRPGALV